MGTYQESGEHAPLLAHSREAVTSFSNSGTLSHAKAATATGTTVPSSQTPRPRNWRLVVSCILCTELGERLTFYSVYANLVLFCTNVLMFTNATALSINQAFSGKLIYL